MYDDRTNVIESAGCGEQSDIHGASVCKDRTSRKGRKYDFRSLDLYLQTVRRVPSAPDHLVLYSQATAVQQCHCGTALLNAVLPERIGLSDSTLSLSGASSDSEDDGACCASRSSSDGELDDDVLQIHCGAPRQQRRRRLSSISDHVTDAHNLGTTHIIRSTTVFRKVRTGMLRKPQHCMPSNCGAVCLSVYSKEERRRYFSTGILSPKNFSWSRDTRARHPYNPPINYIYL